MTDIQPVFDQQIYVPEDLREWIEPDVLVCLLFDAMHAGSDNRHVTLGSQRTLLTLLTYGYGVGLLSSDEIERQVLADRHMIYLAARSCPSANDLRRFRRLQRAGIEMCLSKFIGSAVRYQQSKIQPERAWRAGGAFLPHGQDLDQFFLAAAASRIDEAILLDSMALDD